MDNVYDKMFYDQGEYIGGLDESGVVDMAGPLVAACVVLPKIELHRDDLRIFEVNDSKQTPEKYRKYYAEIVWQMAIAIGIGEVTPEEVDYFGNPVAIKMAMTRAVVACKKTTDGSPLIPDYLMLDGTINQLDLPIRQNKIGKGDTKSLCIASASIVAKVYRDEAMIKFHHKSPWYDWVSNKGHTCDNQFEGLDSHGIELGIHRVRSWPFILDDEKMIARKKRWKQATIDRVFQELKTQLEDLKKPS